MVSLSLVSAQRLVARSGAIWAGDKFATVNPIRLGFPRISVLGDTSKIEPINDLARKCEIQTKNFNNGSRRRRLCTKISFRVL